MDANTTIIISLVTLVLAIFGASWLNQRANEKLLEQMEKRFEAKFETLTNHLTQMEKRFDSQFGNVNNRLEQIEKRLDRVERQLESIFKPVLPK